MSVKSTNLYFFITLSLLSLAICIKAGLKQISEIDTKQKLKTISNTLKFNRKFKHHVYDQIAYVVDTYGPRVYGTKNLELVIDYMEDLLKKSKFENVRKEVVPDVPVWTRGNESLTLFSPRPFPVNIPMIGLGGSIGANIKAKLIVVTDIEELKKKENEVKGKIVLLNHKWVDYDTEIKYRLYGAVEAAKVGAEAVLVRSITPVSIESPHTGLVKYKENVRRIPAAAISLEDADMFERMQQRGQTIEVQLKMDAYWEQKHTESHNLVGEIKGYKYPDEVILIGGHIDSWDTGPQTGANDDAAGFFVCFEAIRLLIEKDIRPKRTIRFIAWTGEEFGGAHTGARQYEKDHSNQMQKFVAAFESDMGTTLLEGFAVSSTNKAFSQVKELIDKYLPQYKLQKGDGDEADTEILYEKHGIPVFKNLVKDTNDSRFYFTYHHSAGDTMSILNKDDLDSNVLGIASLFFLIADADEPLHKELPKL